jgi:hypothetical protein
MSVSDTSRTAALDGRFREEDRGAPARGERQLTAILPSGRVVWLRVTPALASVSSVRDLASRGAASSQERRAALLRQRASLARLARSADADARRLSQAQVRRARTLRQRLAAGAMRLERRFATARDANRRQIERHVRSQEEAIARAGRRAFWDSLVVASAAPLFSAFGQVGQPFGEHNLVLTLSLLVWLAGDEVVDAVFGAAAASDHSPHDTDIWSYLAPVGNVLTGYWLLSGRQHEKFVTALTPVTTFTSEPSLGGRHYTYVATVDLAPLLAVDHVEDFRNLASVPVVATVSEAVLSSVGQAADARIESVSARVEAATLTITVTATVTGLRRRRPPGPAIFDRLVVAWMVDALPATTE